MNAMAACRSAAAGDAMDILWRFLIGGAVVSAFAVLGDLFKPKSFAGLFGAAPSVALATLGLTIAKHGTHYASIEGRSMAVGALALFVYSQTTALALMRGRWQVLPTTVTTLALWFAVAFVLYHSFLGSAP